MAAIGPRIEQPFNEEISPIERKGWKCASASGGLSGLNQGPACATPREVLEKDHTGLLTMNWLRSAVAQELIGRHIRVERAGSKVLLVLDEAVGQNPLWNPPASPNAKQFSLLSWTSKMACPSFSLPAGALSVGGACPGADAGQSVVPPSALVVANRVAVERIGSPVRLADAICQKCVAGDTRVMVRKRGLVRVDDLVGEEFEVWSGIGWRKTRAVRTGIRSLVEVRTNWGLRLRCTSDHKILSDGNWVEAEALESGDRLDFSMPSEVPFPIDKKIVRRRDALDGSARYRTAVEEHFPSDWTYEVGLVLGYILGDGHVYGSQYPTVGVSAGRKDRQDLEGLRDIVAGWCGTQAEVHDVSVKPSGLVESTIPSEMSHIAWRVKGLAEFIEDLGLDKTPPPDERRAPASIWSASREGVRGFLSGIFSTDGSVTMGSKIEVSVASVSKGLLEDVQILLASFGIRSSICPYATSNRWRADQGYHSLWKLGINAIAHICLFRDRIGFFNQRKAVRLAELLGVCDQVGQNRYPVVVSVEPCRIAEPVYDLVDVGNEHQFVANGLTVHNCYATGGQYSTGSVQYAQLVRFAWCRAAVANGSFASIMVDAIGTANFKLSGERSGKKFFRIHDSGDFFSPEYLRAWKRVAETLPEITFWAPTRIWVTKWGTDAVNANVAPNFVLRASAYHVGDKAPESLGPGWASGTTAIAKSEQSASDERFRWNCPAYAADTENHTCREGRAPDGERGCRVCWVYPAQTVNYTLH